LGNFPSVKKEFSQHFWGNFEKSTDLLSMIVCEL